MITLLFALTAKAMALLDSPIGSDWEFFATMGLFTLPLVVPTAFISAVLVWRFLPANIPHFDAVGGFLATLGTYLLATLVLFVLNAAVVVLYGQFDQFLEAAQFSGFVGLFALVTTFWLTFPTGSIAAPFTNASIIDLSTLYGTTSSIDTPLTANLLFTH